MPQICHKLILNPATFSPGFHSLLTSKGCPFKGVILRHHDALLLDRLLVSLLVTGTLCRHAPQHFPFPLQLFPWAPSVLGAWALPYTWLSWRHFSCRFSPFIFTSQDPIPTERAWQHDGNLGTSLRRKTFLWAFNGNPCGEHRRAAKGASWGDHLNPAGTLHAGGAGPLHPPWSRPRVPDPGAQGSVSPPMSQRKALSPSSGWRTVLCHPTCAAQDACRAGMGPGFSVRRLPVPLPRDSPDSRHLHSFSIFLSYSLDIQLFIEQQWRNTKNVNI